MGSLSDAFLGGARIRESRLNREQSKEQSSERADQERVRNNLSLFGILAKRDDIKLQPILEGMFPEMGKNIDFSQADSRRDEFKLDAASHLDLMKNGGDRNAQVQSLGAIVAKYGDKGKQLASTFSKGLPVDPGSRISVSRTDAVQSLKNDPNFKAKTPFEQDNAITARQIKLGTQIKVDKVQGAERAKQEAKLDDPLLEKANNTFFIKSLRGVEQHQSLNDLNQIADNEDDEHVTLTSSQLKAFDSLSSTLPSAQRVVSLAREAFDSTTSIGATIEGFKSSLANIPFVQQLIPSKIRSYKQLTNELIANIARSQGHTGVLTELDVFKAFDALPKGGDTKRMRELKLLTLDDVINNSESNFLMRVKDKKRARANFKRRMQNVMSLAEKMEDNSVSKTVGGVEMTFPVFFDSMVDKGKSIDEIKNIWDSPLGYVDNTTQNPAVNAQQDTGGFKIKGFSK